MNIFITGVSSGLGKSLMEEYTNQGHHVYGITRDDIDLQHIDQVNIQLPKILKSVTELDVVIFLDNPLVSVTPVVLAVSVKVAVVVKLKASEVKSLDDKVSCSVVVAIYFYFKLLTNFLPNIIILYLKTKVEYHKSKF